MHVRFGDYGAARGGKIAAGSDDAGKSLCDESNGESLSGGQRPSAARPFLPHEDRAACKGNARGAAARLAPGGGPRGALRQNLWQSSSQGPIRARREYAEDIPVHRMPAGHADRGINGIGQTRRAHSALSLLQKEKQSNLAAGRSVQRAAGRVKII